MLSNREHEIQGELTEKHHIKQITEELLIKLNDINQDPQLREKFYDYPDYNSSGDTGFREIQSAGLNSMADEKDVERALKQIL